MPRLSQPLNGFALIACGVTAALGGAFIAATLATRTSSDVAPITRQAVRDGHLGLVGMRERLSRVGGTLSVRVTCLVPLGVAA